MIKFHIKFIPFDKINSDRIRSNQQKNKNVGDIENKLTRFQIYNETEVACTNYNDRSSDNSRN